MTGLQMPSIKPAGLIGVDRKQPVADHLDLRGRNRSRRDRRAGLLFKHRRTRRAQAGLLPP